MATIGDLLDRIYREWLHKLGNQPLGIELATAVNDSTLTWTLGAGMTPEELSYPKSGTILECGTEQVRIADFDPDTLTASLRVRGYDGTTAAAHDQWAQVLIDPPYPRNALLGQLGDEIVGLHPELWAVVTEDAVIDGVVELGARAEGFLYARDFDGNQLDGLYLSGYQGVDSGRAVSFSDSVGSSAWITYTTGFLRPTSESDTLESLGLEDRWQQLLIVSTVGAALRGQELDLTTIEFLTEAIEAQGVRIGSPTDVATAMLRWRQLLIQNAKSALLARTGIPTVMNRVI